MKISVDRNLCQANAICVGMAPELFDLDDDDRLHVLVEEIPSASSVAARQVVASCPVGALVIADESQ